MTAAYGDDAELSEFSCDFFHVCHNNNHIINILISDFEIIEFDIRIKLKFPGSEEKEILRIHQNFKNSPLANILFPVIMKSLYTTEMEE